MKKLILLIGFIGALLYSNWLLGYWLNSRVTKYGLASDLQMHNQPYGWLFILGDILSGLVIAVTAYLIYLLWRPCDHSKLYLIIGFLCFGTLTAVAALLPIHCGTNILQCGLGKNQTFGIHDIAGAMASFGQFISLIALSLGFLFLWSLSGVIFLILTFQNLDEVAMQHAFLLLTSLGVMLVPYSVVLASDQRQSD